MVMRATCHHEVRGTCSQEEGSLQLSSSIRASIPRVHGKNLGVVVQ